MANAYHSKEKYAQISSKIRGLKRSQSTKDKISQALKGHKHSPETLAKLRGRKVSDEGRKKISEAMKGRIPWNKGKTGVYSNETIEKLRNANLGKKTSPEVKKKLRDSMIKFFKAQNSSYLPPDYFLGENDRKHENIRQMRIRENGGFHTKFQWENLKAAYNYECNICRRKEPEIKLTKDHIISIKNSGNNSIGNIQPLCRSCNSKKR